MRWTERQRAMLAEMGVRLWLPPSGDDDSMAAAAGRDAEVVPASPGAAGMAEPPVPARAGTTAGAPPARPSGAPASAPHAGAPAAGLLREPLRAAPAAAPRDRDPAIVRDAPMARGAGAASPHLPGDSAARIAMQAAGAGHAVFVPPADAARRATEIARLDWSGLRASAAACTACPLCEGRTHSVFVSAPGPADWLVVTDPPGPEDDATGVPMSGAPGRLLDNMLRAVRRSRADTALPAQRASVVPIVKCRPPGDRAPSAAEIETCRPYLERQIELVRPNVVLAMGRFAAPGLLRRNEPLGTLRGRVQAGPAPVVATFHPAHLLRHPDDKAKTWDDLCRAAAAASGTTTAAESGTAAVEGAGPAV